MLVGCAGAQATRKPTGPIGPEPLPEASASREVARLVGWGDARVTVAAAAWWRPADGAVPIQASVLVRADGDRRELLLALVENEQLVGRIPLATAEGRGRTTSAAIGELPLGIGERILRVDVRTFETGGAGRFAVKAILVGAGAHKVLERLVESGDRVRDRRARLETGDGGTIVALERESGDPTTHRLVYQRGPDGRFATRDRSIFDP